MTGAETKGADMRVLLAITFFLTALGASAQEETAERYGDCVDRLLPVRYRTHRLGGSFAQRDIIGWTLLEAALRDRRYDLALGLANERAALKPTSVQGWRAVARAFKGLGNTSKANQADAKATSLLAA